MNPTETLYPYLYSSRSDIPKYSVKAIESLVDYVKEYRSSITQVSDDYKYCPALKSLIIFAFELWQSVWGAKEVYPVRGAVREECEKMCPSAMEELIHTSKKRFIDIIVEVVWSSYDIPSYIYNPDTMSPTEVIAFVWESFDKLELKS